MNLLILHPEDFVDDEHAIIRDRRHQHIVSVHRGAAGDTLKAGLLNGNAGTAEILETGADTTRLRVVLTDAPVAALPLRLIMAMPRPKMFRRCLQHITAMGVKDIVLINAVRVEKSFWQTPWLEPDNLREQMLLGLEQAVDTQLPQIRIEKRFKPFVEDDLSEFAAGTRKLVAHPVTDTPCPVDMAEPATLAVGPEGGFIPYEVEKLQEQGFEVVHLGKRILRVETAIPVLISRLFPSR
ncbi:16S rRNA (uracil(1498)-N(3))-methyltransferase [Biformimicrobium ophioploci]|uniref:Ribosomal RNA small subunit methyltransferase E n=1 Tax=Biformimicrobium ophioploci TaxID=3036711 RepID=A0ABQ6LZX9_9GAMM|nr:16S rRNA (uracil(1498)-N(3))-methyltransferase [Microbulbifer sp. NKW57]GMG87636.1 16S rRNA (uracil(1498)-N(3))-methyltransferase [Microbulbifer sp. NKW57]